MYVRHMWRALIAPKPGSSKAWDDKSGAAFCRSIGGFSGGRGYSIMSVSEPGRIGSVFARNFFGYHCENGNEIDITACSQVVDNDTNLLASVACNGKRVKEVLRFFSKICFVL